LTDPQLHLFSRLSSPFFEFFFNCKPVLCHRKIHSFDMFAKSAIVGSLFFLSAVNAVVIPAKRDLIDDATSLLGNAVSDLSSVYSVGTSYITDASSYYSDGLSYANSAISQASSDVSTYLHGGENTLLTGWVTVSNGVTLTEVSEIGGSVVTLAASGQGTPTTLGGQVFTVMTAAPSPPPASGTGPRTSSPTPSPTPSGTGSGSSANNNSAGFKPGMSTFLTSLVGVAAWLVL